MGRIATSLAACALVASCRSSPPAHHVDAPEFVEPTDAMPDAAQPTMRVLHGARDDDETEEYRVWVARAPGRSGPVTVVAGETHDAGGRNRLLLDMNDAGMFVTVLYGVLDAAAAHVARNGTKRLRRADSMREARISERSTLSSDLIACRAVSRKSGN